MRSHTLALALICSWALVAVFLMPTVVATAGIVSPSVGGAINDIGADGTPDELWQYVELHTVSFLGSSEIRGILEYDISSLAPVVPLSMLHLDRGTWGWGSGPGDYPRTVSLYYYGGDGLFGLSDFSATASLLDSATFPDETSSFVPVSFDVTSALQSLRDSGFDYLGLRLLVDVPHSTRFDGPMSYLLVDAASIPEPFSLIFFGTGLAGVCGVLLRKKMAERPLDRPRSVVGD